MSKSAVSLALQWQILGIIQHLPLSLIFTSLQVIEHSHIKVCLQEAKNFGSSLQYGAKAAARQILVCSPGSHVG